MKLQTVLSCRLVILIISMTFFYPLRVSSVSKTAEPNLYCLGSEELRNKEYKAAEQHLTAGLKQSVKERRKAQTSKYSPDDYLSKLTSLRHKLALRGDWKNVEHICALQLKANQELHGSESFDLLYPLQALAEAKIHLNKLAEARALASRGYNILQPSLDEAKRISKLPLSQNGVSHSFMGPGPKYDSRYLTCKSYEGLLGALDQQDKANKLHNDMEAFLHPYGVDMSDD